MDLPPAAYLLVLSHYRFGRVVCHILFAMLKVKSLKHVIGRDNGKLQVMMMIKKIKWQLVLTESFVVLQLNSMQFYIFVANK